MALLNPIYCYKIVKIMPYIDEAKGIYAEDVKCTCGWKGTEIDLVVDFYDSHNMSNPIATNCPKCGAYCSEA